MRSQKNSLVKAKIFLLIFICGSCSSGPIKPIQTQASTSFSHSLSREALQKIFLKKDHLIAPGFVASIRFKEIAGIGSKLFCNHMGSYQEVPSFPEQDGLRAALVPSSYFATYKKSEEKSTSFGKIKVQGEFDCELRVKSQESFDSYPLAKFYIIPHHFPESTIKVSRMRGQTKAELKRIKDEQALVNRIYKENRDAPVMFFGPFKKPLDSKVTSIFGTKRKYVSKDKVNEMRRGQHLGVDFRAAIGTPIPVSNRGKVIFAGDLFYTGGTVIVSHGAGIFTLYCHLSKLRAEKGDLVSQGQIIGEAGMSGRVTGPHLHWGAKVQGLLVNGLSLTEQNLNLKIQKEGHSPVLGMNE